MARLVMCAKLGRELPGLDEPPFQGELGQRIYERISAEAYAGWQAHAKTLIASYRLNLAESGARDFLREQMEEYFFGENAQMPDWFGGDSPAPGGKGAKGGAAPPARKK
ncbi:MAG: oxidative damage protection protein [Thermomicrobiales bacterium]|jgi:Fe-S cluster biosynthesis and repair protein YggX